MTTVLYYIEPERVWLPRGYAKNLYLNINHAEKTFYTCETAYLNPSPAVNNIKTSKQDILKYITALKNAGYCRLTKK